MIWKIRKVMEGCLDIYTLHMKINKCAYVKDQADKAHDSDNQEIEFKRYTSITVTKGLRNRENM